MDTQNGHICKELPFSKSTFLVSMWNVQCVCHVYAMLFFRMATTPEKLMKRHSEDRFLKNFRAANKKTSCFGIIYLFNAALRYANN